MVITNTVLINVRRSGGSVNLPTHGSELSAGYDITAIDDPRIVGEEIILEGEFSPYYRRIDYIEYRTGLYIRPQDGTPFQHHRQEIYHTLLYPKSSIRKYNLALANSIGLIDGDYTGELIVCFNYIWQPEDYIIRDGVLLGRPNKQKIYKKGDGIIQLVASPTNLIEFQMVDDLGSTSRGSGGFGSTSNTTRAMKMQVEEASPKSQILKSLGEAIQSPSPVSDGTFGGMAELYHKSGGIQVRRKYSEEIKQTRSES